MSFPIRVPTNVDYDPDYPLKTQRFTGQTYLDAIVFTNESANATFSITLKIERQLLWLILRFTNEIPQKTQDYFRGKLQQFDLSENAISISGTGTKTLFTLLVNNNSFVLNNSFSSASRYLTTSTLLSQGTAPAVMTRN